MFLSKLLSDKISHYKRLSIVEGRLTENFKDKFEGLKDILAKSDSAITGSYLIQCVLNEKWEESDIDIFIPYKEGFLSPSNNKSSMVDQWIYDNGGTFNGYQESERYGNPVGSDEVIFFIRNYKFNGFNVQTILVDHDNIEEYVNDNFDFDICKNVYKGGSYLKFKDIGSILRKKFNFDYANNIRSSAKRKFKYQQRGFEIVVMQSVIDKFLDNPNPNRYSSNRSTESGLWLDASSKKYNRYDIFITENEIKKLDGRILFLNSVSNTSIDGHGDLAIDFPYSIHWKIDETFIGRILNNASEFASWNCIDSCPFKMFGLMHSHFIETTLSGGRYRYNYGGSLSITSSYEYIIVHKPRSKVN